MAISWFVLTRQFKKMDTQQNEINPSELNILIKKVKRLSLVFYSIKWSLYLFVLIILLLYLSFLISFIIPLVFEYYLIILIINLLIVLTCGILLLKEWIFPLLNPLKLISKIGDIFFKDTKWDCLAYYEVSLNKKAKKSEEKIYSPLQVIAHDKLIKKLNDDVNFKWFPWKEILPPIYAFLILGVIYIITSTIVPSRFAIGYPYISPTIIEKNEPLVANLIFKLKYPEYMKKNARIIEGVGGNLTLPQGTLVTINGKLLIDNFDHATISINNKEIPLEIKNNNYFEGKFIAAEQINYQFKIYKDKKIYIGTKMGIDIESDIPPKILILKPVEDRIFLKKRENMEIQYQVEDEYGISKIALVYEMEDKLHVVTLKTFETASKRYRGTWIWPLDQIPLIQGRDLSFHIEAWDSSQSASQAGISRIIKIKLYSSDQLTEDTLQLIDLFVQKSIDLLGFRLEYFNHLNNDQIKAKEYYVPINQKTEAYFNTLLKLKSKLNSYDIDNQLKMAIQTIDERQRRLWNDEKSLYTESPNLLSKKSKIHYKIIGELEQNILVIVELLNKKRWESSLQFVNNYKQEIDRFNKVITQYGRNLDKIKESIIPLIENLKGLAELLQSRLSSSIKYTPVQKNHNIPDDKILFNDNIWQRLENSVINGDVEEANRIINQINQILTQYSMILQNQVVNIDKKNFSNINQDINKIHSKLESLIKDQNEINLELFDFNKKNLKYYQNKIDRNLYITQKTVARNLEKIITNWIDSKNLSTYYREKLNQAKARINDAIVSLKIKDFNQTYIMLDKAESYMDQIKSYIEMNNKTDEMYRRKVVNLFETLTDSRKKIKSVIQIDPQYFSKGDRGEVTYLMNKEEKIMKGTEELLYQMQSLKSLELFLPKNIFDSVKIARNYMRDSFDLMNRLNVSSAIKRGEMASEELYRVKTDFFNPSNQNNSDNYGLEILGSNEENIIIPTEEDDRNRELYKSVIKLMDQPIPQIYEQAIYEYYQQILSER